MHSTNAIFIHCREVYRKASPPIIRIDHTLKAPWCFGDLAMSYLKVKADIGPCARPTMRYVPYAFLSSQDPLITSSVVTSQQVVNHHAVFYHFLTTVPLFSIIYVTSQLTAEEPACPWQEALYRVLYMEVSLQRDIHCPLLLVSSVLCESITTLSQTRTLCIHKQIMFIQVTFTHRVCNTSLSNFLGIISPLSLFFTSCELSTGADSTGSGSLSVPNSGGGLLKHGGHGSSSSFSVTVIGSMIHSSWPRHHFTFSVLCNTSLERGSLRR